MNKILYIILTLLLFSLTIISCSPDDTEKVNEPISKTGDTVGDVVDPVGEGINDGLDPVGDGINDGLDSVGDGINDGLDSVGDVVNDGVGAITGGSTGGAGGGSEIIHTKFNINMSKVPWGGSCSVNYDIKQTDDGGYIIAACNDGKASLVKLDVYGELQWEKIYRLDDYWGNRDVIQTSDGGYLFVGWTGYLKTDSSGKMLWKKKGAPGKPAQNPYYEDVIEHSNGNYYLVGGPVEEQAIMVKISPTGSVLHTKFYGGSCADDIFRSVIESNDGKLIMVGEKTHGNGPYPCSFYFRYWKDIWVVKTGKNGGKIWYKEYGGKFLEKGTDIVRTTDSDGYIVLGQKCAHGGRIMDCGSSFSAVILKINEEGDTLNENFLPGLRHWESGQNMALANTHLGGYVFVTESKGKNNLWIKKWGKGEKNMELKLNVWSLAGSSIMRTNDNGFIISAGKTIIKTDSNFASVIKLAESCEDGYCEDEYDYGCRESQRYWWCK